ncbi:MAG: heparinase II/III family protein [Fidelibacterota bacterium]|nr:MAG: heparinase II/III family protein [Candidatus Neomarinimicrobiota bacterium]
MKYSLTIILIAACCWSWSCSRSAQSLPPAPRDVLSTLKKDHPRLILDEPGLAKLKENLKEDKLLQKCRDDVLKEADGYLDRPALTYRKIGPRLLRVSRACVSRMYALGLAWRLTGRKAYAEKAVENLLAVCRFQDWNPSHFLDVAEMSHAVAIGYDWFYDYLDADTRNTVRSALIEKGLKAGITAYQQVALGDAYESEYPIEVPYWWATVEHNWNQVCNGGLIIGALAVAETDPIYAERIILTAVKYLPIAISKYGPDGAWPEGPSYWNYATRYTVYCLAALESALGTDFGLSRIDGFSQAALFPIFMAGPTGLYFNFADAGERSRIGNLPPLFWLAKRFDLPIAAQAERGMIADSPADPLDLIWYIPRGDREPGPPLLDKLFRGPVEVAVFRSDWGDTNAIFIGVKAGYNQVNHAHLDVGSFVMDALGTRWIKDLGSDDYNLPGYWEEDTQEGQRWAYFRLNSFSHNIPVLDNENQNVLAETKIVRFESNDSSGFALVDLTSAYERSAEEVRRGIALVQNRSAVLVQDEFRLKTVSDIAWGLTTDAEISLQQDRVILTKDGRQLIVKILSPASASFVVESAEQKPPEKPNLGVKRLIMRLDDQRVDLRIAVLLSPVREDSGTLHQPELSPLANW